MLPVITQSQRLDDLRVAPARFDDLPALLAPYATASPIFVYLLPDGHVLASRVRRCEKELDDDDLILVLSPRRRFLSASLENLNANQVSTTKPPKKDYV